MYQLTASGTSVIRLADGMSIPLPPTEREGRKYMEWLAAGNTPQPAPVAPIAEIRIAAQRRVDADAGRITIDTIGGLAEEYTTAEKHALEFQAAGYLPPVPASVQSWSDAKAIRGIVFTPQQAAEDILATAAAWRGALDLIRQQRLAAKAHIDMAADASAVDAAYSAWLGFVAAIRAQLGLS